VSFEALVLEPTNPEADLFKPYSVLFCLRLGGTEPEGLGAPLRIGRPKWEMGRHFAASDRAWGGAAISCVEEGGS